MNYLNREEISLSSGSTGKTELCVTVEGEISEIADIRPAFPLDTTENYISLLGKEGKEIAMIEDLNELDGPVADHIRKELRYRYFIPEVDEIIKIKREYGFIAMNLRTGGKEREISVHMTEGNSFEKEGDLFVKDSFGMRFQFKDFRQNFPRYKNALEALL